MFEILKKNWIQAILLIAIIVSMNITSITFSYGLYIIFSIIIGLFGLQIYKEVKDKRLTLKLKQTIKEVISLKEEADLANRSKTQFLATMSHELRTPLTAIIGYSEMMLIEFKGELNDDYKAYVQQINNSSKYLSRIIVDILDVSKIETGSLKIENEEFLLKSLFDTVLDLHIRRIKEKGIKFVLINEVKQLKILGDKTRIQQILSNLLSNSYKFTDEGEIRLELFVEDNDLHFIVCDTGKGMSQETLDNFFVSFFRAPDTEAIEGTGLGSAIIKKLVEAHGGDIKVESELGVGTTVEVILPCSRIINT